MPRSLRVQVRPFLIDGIHRQQNGDSGTADVVHGSCRCEAMLHGWARSGRIPCSAVDFLRLVWIHGCRERHCEHIRCRFSGLPRSKHTDPVEGVGAKASPSGDPTLPGILILPAQAARGRHRSPDDAPVIWMSRENAADTQSTSSDQNSWPSMAVMSCNRESAAVGETASEVNAVLEESRTNPPWVQHPCFLARFCGCPG